MKKSLLLFILVLCVNFTSCNKDDLEERNEELIIQIASLQIITKSLIQKESSKPTT